MPGAPLSSHVSSVARVTSVQGSLTKSLCLYGYKKSESSELGVKRKDYILIHSDYEKGS